MASLRLGSLLLSSRTVLAHPRAFSATATLARTRIYTRTGDQGQTSLYTGTRKGKDDDIFEALGTTDELSSFIGMARQWCQKASNKELDQQLEHIQCVLQDMGSNIATPRNDASATQLAKVTFPAEHVKTLEEWIDKMDETIPPLRNFILPAGGFTSSSLHCARSIARRAERRIVPLVQQSLCDESVLRYMNRLSDYLFTAARYASKLEGVEDVIYKKPSQ